MFVRVVDVIFINMRVVNKIIFIIPCLYLHTVVIRKGEYVVDLVFNSCLSSSF